MLTNDCAFGQIDNLSEQRVQVLWRNHAENELVVVIDSIDHGLGTEIGSYEGHEFVVRWPDETQPVDRTFIKGPGQEVVTVRRGEQENAPVLHQDSEFFRRKAATRAALDACIAASDSPSSRNHCIAPIIVESIDSSAQLARLNSASRSIAEKLLNYECKDADVRRNQPVRTVNTLWPRFGFPYVNHTISIFVDTPTAKIGIVNDFVSEAECEYMANNTALQEVPIGTHGHAWTGTFTEHFGRFGHPMFRLQVKAADFVGLMVGEPMLTASGQEGFVLVRNGSDSTVHCDGACSGGIYHPGGRVATVSMFCEVPTAEDGKEQGGVLFTKSGVFLRPKRREAILLYYRGEDWQMDMGLTEHAACPTTGSSYVINYWLRDNVNGPFPGPTFDEKGSALRDTPAADGEPSSATTTLNILH